MDAEYHTAGDFLNAVKKLDNSNVKGVNSILDQLIALEYEKLEFTDEAAQDLLQRLVKLIPKNNSHLLSKFCCFLQTFLRRTKVGIDSPRMNQLLEFVIGVVNDCDVWILPDVLFALSRLLRSRELINEKVYNTLFNSDNNLLQICSNSKDINTSYAAMECFQSLTLKRKNISLSPDIVADIYSVCISCLRFSINHSDDEISCVILLSTLKCLRNILLLKNIAIDNHGELLGLLKALMFCGFPEKTPVPAVCLYPTLLGSYTPEQAVYSREGKINKQIFQRHTKHRIRSKSKKKSVGRKHAEETCQNSKEEFEICTAEQKAENSLLQAKQTPVSDSDEGNHFVATDSSETMMDQHQSHVREYAYKVFVELLKVVEKKVMFGYWSSFLPHCVSADAGTNSWTICTSILKDPSWDVRIISVDVLSEILRGSKQFLSLVDERTVQSTSFISVSSILTSMIKEVHQCLCCALCSQKCPEYFTRILKCYAILVDNIPYKRLNCEHLLALLDFLKHFVSYRDTQVRVACLTLCGAMLNSDQVPYGISMQLIHSREVDISGQQLQSTPSKCSADNDNGSNCSSASNSHIPWLIEVCKNYVLNKGHAQPLPVQVESLQVLAIISVKYFSFIRNLMPLMEKIILTCLQDDKVLLRVHGAKLLEAVGSGLSREFGSRIAASNDGSSEEMDIVFDFWSSILSEPFVVCLKNPEQYTVQAICCDCLSTLPFSVFSKLPKHTKIFYITLLLGMASDFQPNVKSCAVRCLGVFAVFPCLREDLSFLSDATRILVEAVDDENFFVRMKAAWALGNITDALFLSRDEFPEFSREITSSFLNSIGMAAVKASDEGGQIQASCVRVLGNLLHFLPSEVLNCHEIQELIKKAHSALLAALSSKLMKVCWNACYALQNVLKSKDLISLGILDLEETFQKLMCVLKSPNFKVRINGALALSALPSREFYSDSFAAVYSRLIETINCAQSDVDFKEMRHFENLNDTICYCLCQLICLVNEKDLEMVQKISFDAAEVLLKSMWKFGCNTDSQRMSTVSAAKLQTERLVSQQQNHLSLLELWKDILIQAETAYHQEHKS